MKTKKNEFLSKRYLAAYCTKCYTSVGFQECNVL
jgi:hypothetical protein